MDYYQLRYFCAVASSGSLRKAAEILHLSPAALSKSVHLLEDELGKKLILKSGRNIVITDQGLALAERAKTLLRDFDQLRTDLEKGPDSSNEVRICTFEVFSTHFLEALKVLDWDDRKITLHDVVPGEVERAILERKADVGITYMPIPHPDLDLLMVTRIEMGVFTRKGAFPDADQKSLPFVVPALPLFGVPSRTRGLDGWPDDAYPRNIKYQVTLLESGLEICRQGRAAGYFPVFVVEAHNRKVRTELRLDRRPSPYRGRKCFTEVFLVKRKGDEESREMKELAKAIRLFCKSA